MIPYHRFLIRTRRYCADCSGLVRATHVIKDERGHDKVVCAFHAGISVNEAPTQQELDTHIGQATQ